MHCFTDTETENHSMFCNFEMWNNSGAKLSIEKSRWDLTFIRNRLWGQRGMDWEFGVGRCKLLHLEWIKNKVLLYSTGNYIQYPVKMENRKRM